MRDFSNFMNSLSKNFSVFIGSLCLHVLLPLAPVLAELIAKGKIDGLVLTLAASMYCFCIAVGSRYIGVFGISLLMGILYALSYGVAAASITTSGMLAADTNNRLVMTDSIGLIIIMVGYTVERTIRHCKIGTEKVFELE